MKCFPTTIEIHNSLDIIVLWATVSLDTESE